MQGGGSAYAKHHCLIFNILVNHMRYFVFWQFVTAHLSFLQFILQEGSLYLAWHRARDIWDTLVANPQASDWDRDVSYVSIHHVHYTTPWVRKTQAAVLFSITSLTKCWLIFKIISPTVFIKCPSYLKHVNTLLSEILMSETHWQFETGIVTNDKSQGSAAACLRCDG